MMEVVGNYVTFILTNVRTGKDDFVILDLERGKTYTYPLSFGIYGIVALTNVYDPKYFISQLLSSFIILELRNIIINYL